MSVSQEIGDCFSKLIEPLATNAGLIELFGNVRGEIVEKFETKFGEQNNKLSSKKVEWQYKKIL